MAPEVLSPRVGFIAAKPTRTRSPPSTLQDACKSVGILARTKNCLTFGESVGCCGTILSRNCVFLCYLSERVRWRWLYRCERWLAVYTPSFRQSTPSRNPGGSTPFHPVVLHRSHSPRRLGTAVMPKRSYFGVHSGEWSEYRSGLGLSSSQPH